MNNVSNSSTSNQSALHLLHRAGQCADELFTLNVSGTELTPRQYEVLKAVADQPDPSQTTLVQCTGIDRSTLADIVRRLSERDLLVRRRTPEDARKYAVRLTQKGVQILAQAEPAVQATNSSLLDAIPASERANFLESLSTIILAIGSAQAAGNTNSPRDNEAA